MRVSTKSDYALRALIGLATTAAAGAVSGEELGRRQDITCS
jgi:DNA-binding IscR family transcriptional regulator